MAAPLTHKDFQPHVGKIFGFTGSHLRLRLTKLDVLAPYPGIDRVPFSLIFQGPPGDVLREGFYQVDVEDGGEFEFYIIPIHTQVPDRQDYQVVFN